MSPDAVGWCPLVSLTPTSNPNPDPHLAGEQQSVGSTGRERMGLPTLQTHQDPILLLPRLWFEVADQTLPSHNGMLVLSTLNGQRLLINHMQVIL
jgi:hypothetical protein